MDHDTRETSTATPAMTTNSMTPPILPSNLTPSIALNPPHQPSSTLISPSLLESAISKPLPYQSHPPTSTTIPIHLPSPNTALPSFPFLPFTCTAFGSSFLTEAKLGDHIRRSIILEWKGCAIGIHEASTSSLTGFCICEGCGLPFLHKGIPAHVRSCRKNPPHRRLHAPLLESLPLPPLPPPHPAPQLPSTAASSSPALSFLPPLTTAVSGLL